MEVWKDDTGKVDCNGLTRLMVLMLLSVMDEIVKKVPSNSDCPRQTVTKLRPVER
jgi:hypothetical protein